MKSEYLGLRATPAAVWFAFISLSLTTVLPYPCLQNGVNVAHFTELKE